MRVSAAWYAEAVRQAREAGYGGGTAAEPLRVNVEYVSANPTGPLPVSAGRNAAYGDSLARLFAFAGHDVDARVLLQRRRRADRALRSLAARARARRAGARGRLPGRLADRARRADRAPARCARPRSSAAPASSRCSRPSGRRSSASACTWTSTRTRSTCTARAGSSARSSGRARPATCSSRTARRGCARATFGDDKDRVLVKADGAPTYFAGDLAYLVDKLERGFDLAIYVLGADHHGYSARLQGGRAGARLRPRAHRDRDLPDGAPDRGRRAEAHVQAARRRRAARRADGRRSASTPRASTSCSARTTRPIDIDLAQAVEQGPENPVYYVQYAHARICSILRRAGEAAPTAAPDDATGAGAERGGTRARARRLPRRRAARPSSCGRRTASSSTHATWPRRSRRSTATARCWTPTTPERRSSRLALCDATRQVLARALDLVGVSAPEEM